VKTLIISDNQGFHGLIIKSFDNQTVSLRSLSRISDTSENKPERLDSDNQINISRLISFLDRVISRAEILRTGRWLNPKSWAREIMEKLRVAPHSEPLTDTWTSDFLSREGEGREVIGERLRDKTVPWQVQRRLIQAVTDSFPYGDHLH